MLRMVIFLAYLIACQTQAFCQIIQLPSFHSFSYSGTVVVPDGGTTSLGGNTYSSSSRSQRSGLFPGPIARSGQSQFGNAAATATIIDHQAIDQQLLGQSRRQMIDRQEAINRQVDRQERGMKTADRTEEGKSLVRYARSLYEQRRYADARDAYEMAVAILDPSLQKHAIAEMRRLGLRR